MSGYPIDQKLASATLDDCVRLWSTLTSDYIPGLRIELKLERDGDLQPVIFLELCDYSTLTSSPELARSCWSSRPFRSALHSISVGQLFDLLITGYRVMEQYFTTGEDNRPRR
jgi:hypothetical protein